ncbi:MAG TPA: FGGY family carbohydrate kinase, partial [Kiritimatiellia bacterium]|nr:FGGY family carbohydrate kinase [Kiritimatiellia bacterium]
MKKNSFILSLDQGTTSSRALLFDRELNIVAMAQQEFDQFYPQPGWVEHDPEEIWRSQRKVMANVLKQVPDGPAAVAAIGVTNQRETVVVWNRRTGEPIYPAIVWQCRRTADFCSELKRRDYGPRIRDKTGLVIDAYFSASKLRWILDHVDGAREAAQRGELLCGTIDSWLLWKLSNGTAHVTDYTNA